MTPSLRARRIRAGRALFFTTLQGALLALTLGALAQQPGAVPPTARGLYNWVHTTADAERAFAFYRDTLELALAPSPFVPAGAAPEGIRPAGQAGSDALVWNLTNTHGARFRTVFMRATNTPFGLELSEFFDIPRDERPANAWDPGASKLIFAVRDLDLVMGRMRRQGAKIVTLGDSPVATRAGRSIVVRDPDGYLIELRQASAGAIASATAPGPVVTTSIGITVADLRRALEFYEGLLGLTVRGTERADDALLRVHGLDGGELTITTVTIPGIDATVEIARFAPPATAAPAKPFRWRIQDVGAPQFQLEVAGLDALLARTSASGYAFLSVGGQPIERPFGRFVFAIDPDGVLVEFVEPTTPR